MKNGRAKISKREWYKLGGLTNSKLFRKANKAGVWSYYILID